eukprot:TRINITY_DN6824_c3_g1_i1.p1 TRINITY_DN6824_c3_g1~~TRINITY_DN6824_c3_g1_i1.p1  ORF type:complete len:554 (+),score=100.84 TRINITY_DN6824_c3_g1_i1:112-1662(+)
MSMLNYLGIPRVKIRSQGIASLSVARTTAAAEDQNKRSLKGLTAIDELFANLQQEYLSDKATRKSSEADLHQKFARKRMRFQDSEQRSRTDVQKRQDRHFECIKNYFRAGISRMLIKEKDPLQHVRARFGVNKFFAPHLAKEEEMMKRSNQVRELQLLTQSVGKLKRIRNTILPANPLGMEADLLTNSNVDSQSFQHVNTSYDRVGQLLAADLVSDIPSDTEQHSKQNPNNDNDNSVVVLNFLDMQLFPKRASRKKASATAIKRLFSEKCSNGLGLPTEPYSYAEKLFRSKLSAERAQQLQLLIREESDARSEHLQSESASRSELLKNKQIGVRYVIYIHERNDDVAIQIHISNLVLGECEKRKIIFEQQTEQANKLIEAAATDRSEISKRIREREERRKKLIASSHAAFASAYLTNAQLRRLQLAEIRKLSPRELAHQCAAIETDEEKYRSLVSDQMTSGMYSLVNLCTAIANYITNKLLANLVKQQYEDRRCLVRYQRECFAKLIKDQGFSTKH